MFTGDVADLRLRSDENRDDQPVRRSLERTTQRGLVARMCHCCWDGIEMTALRECLLVLAGPRVCAHIASRCPTGTRAGAVRAAGPVSLRRKVRMTASATP